VGFQDALLGKSVRESAQAARSIAVQIIEAAGDYALRGKSQLAEETKIAERYRTWLYGQMCRVTVQPSGYCGEPALFVSAPRPYNSKQASTGSTEISG
jgi:hypothetical protein